MREAAFIQRNKSRWEAYEKLVSNPGQARADELADLFIQVTDDLSFARTQYPASRTTQYLNNLARKLHLEIYRNKKEQSKKAIPPDREAIRSQSNQVSTHTWRRPCTTSNALMSFPKIENIF
jgi:hypothetical protein